jgi:hypothetical protein
MAGSYVNASTTRYPHYYDVMESMIEGVDINGVPFKTTPLGKMLLKRNHPYLGNAQLNAQCLDDYLEPSLKAQWEVPFLALGAEAGSVVATKHRKKCHAGGYDRSLRLSGVWFVPELDERPALKQYSGMASLGIYSSIRYQGNNTPLANVSIAWGIKPNLPEGSHLSPPPAAIAMAKLDPTTWTPECPVGEVLLTCLEQKKKPIGFSNSYLSNGFETYPDPTDSDTVNPVPAKVKIGSTVCYDLPRSGGFNGDYDYIFFKLESETKLKAAYFPVNSVGKKCADLISDEEIPDEESPVWVEYTR